MVAVPSIPVRLDVNPDALILRVLADHEGRIQRLEAKMSEESDARDALGVQVAAVGKRFDDGIAKLEAELAAAGVAVSADLTDAITAMKEDAATLAAMHPDAAPATATPDTPAPPTPPATP
jgi:hypothetical protein